MGCSGNLWDRSYQKPACVGMIFVIRAGMVRFLTAVRENCTIWGNMSSEAILTLVILGVTLLMLASQRMRPDLVAASATLSPTVGPLGAV
jgi:hypothetical protein